MADNPIVRRQQKLTRQWREFSEQPQARLGRWLIADDEVGMIRAFYRFQRSEGNDTGDFFMQLSSPFKHPATYAETLQDELFTQIKELQGAIDDPAIQRWQPVAASPKQSPILELLSNMGSFAQCLQLPAGRLVIYLQPSATAGAEAWSDWLVQVLQFGIPREVRWMLTDARDAPALNTIAGYFPEQVVTLVPQLNMSAAVNELASAGDPSELGVQFRKAFVHLTQAIGRQDLPMTDRTATKAFAIAQTNQWPTMQVAVRMAQAGAYLGQQQSERAYQLYGEAYQHARVAYEAKDPAGGKLAVTALFSQGAAMLSAEQYGRAADAYRRAIPHAEETEDYYQLLEAWRMTGFCHQQLGEDEAARDALWEALEIGPKLDEALRPNSTLPYVGQALQHLAQKMGHWDLYDLVRDRMVFLVGRDWAEKVEAV